MADLQRRPSTGFGYVEKAFPRVVVLVSQIERVQYHTAKKRDEGVVHYRKLPIRRQSAMISGQNVLTIFYFLF